MDEEEDEEPIIRRGGRTQNKRTNRRAK